MKCTGAILIFCSLILSAQFPLHSQPDALYWFKKGRNSSSTADKIKFHKKAIELKSKACVEGAEGNSRRLLRRDKSGYLITLSKIEN